MTTLKDVKDYRWMFRDDHKLPCLKCSDKKILACMKIENKNPGCARFKNYARTLDHTH